MPGPAVPRPARFLVCRRADAADADIRAGRRDSGQRDSGQRAPERRGPDGSAGEGGRGTGRTRRPAIGAVTSGSARSGRRVHIGGAVTSPSHLRHHPPLPPTADPPRCPPRCPPAPPRSRSRAHPPPRPAQRPVPARLDPHRPSTAGPRPPPVPDQGPRDIPGTHPPLRPGSGPRRSPRHRPPSQPGPPRHSQPARPPSEPSPRTARRPCRRPPPSACSPTRQRMNRRLRPREHSMGGGRGQGRLLQGNTASLTKRHTDPLRDASRATFRPFLSISPTSML